VQQAVVSAIAHAGEQYWRAGAIEARLHRDESGAPKWRDHCMHVARRIYLTSSDKKGGTSMWISP